MLWRTFALDGVWTCTNVKSSSRQLPFKHLFFEPLRGSHLDDLTLPEHLQGSLTQGGNAQEDVMWSYVMLVVGSVSLLLLQWVAGLLLGMYAAVVA